MMMSASDSSAVFMLLWCLVFFVEWYGDHRVLHLLTHSFPTRRSSDLRHGGRPAPSRRRCGRRADPASVPRCSAAQRPPERSEEHTSELQSLMRISYAVFCLKKQNNHIQLIVRNPPLRL